MPQDATEKYLMDVIEYAAETFQLDIDNDFKNNKYKLFIN